MTTPTHQIKEISYNDYHMTDGAVRDKVTDAVKKSRLKFELFYTNLSKEQEKQLRQDFAS